MSCHRACATKHAPIRSLVWIGALLCLLVAGPVLAGSLPPALAGVDAAAAAIYGPQPDSAGLRGGHGPEGYGLHLAGLQAGQAPGATVGAAEATDEPRVGATRSISGRVTTASGTPIADVVVEAYWEWGEWTECYAWTAADGTYTIVGLPPGLFYIGTWNEKNYVDEWYNNLVRLGRLFGEGATLIDINSADATGKDFQLAAGRSISGKVTGPGGVSLSDLEVDVCDQSGNWLGVLDVTASNGTYTVGGLVSGSYKLCTFNDQNYVDEWYDNVIYQSNWKGAGATLVNIASANVTGKNFQLAQGLQIEGHVYHDPGLAYLPDVWVEVFEVSGEPTGKGAWTNYQGHFAIDGLARGRNYHVGTRNDQHYVDEWFASHSGKVLRAGNDEAVGAWLVPDQIGNYLTFVLDPGFTVSGNITDASTLGPVEADDLEVQLFSSGGQSYGSFWPLPGETAYESYALPGGVYKMRTLNESGYIDEWYDDLPCATYGIGEADPLDHLHGERLRSPHGFDGGGPHDHRPRSRLRVHSRRQEGGDPRPGIRRSHGWSRASPSKACPPLTTLSTRPTRSRPPRHLTSRDRPGCKLPPREAQPKTQRLMTIPTWSPSDTSPCAGPTASTPPSRSPGSVPRVAAAGSRSGAGSW